MSRKVGLLLLIALAVATYFLSHRGDAPSEIATTADHAEVVRQELGAGSPGHSAGGAASSSGSLTTSSATPGLQSGVADDAAAKAARFASGAQSQPASSPSGAPTSTDLMSELKSQTWVGGGFQPPNIPGFDELFREQRKTTAFTYTGKPLTDGTYFGDFGQDENAPQLFFSISLKLSTQNNHQGFVADWFQWQGDLKTPLESFVSSYSENEIYFGFLHLPTSLFRSAQFKNCPEILVVRHFDWDWGGHQSFVDFFNSRVYCRRALDDLTFEGRMGFKKM